MSIFVISCSSDGTARMWTLSGRYLSLLGGFKPFEPLIPDVPPAADRNYVLPADIKRFCSSTTLRVIECDFFRILFIRYFVGFIRRFD